MQPEDRNTILASAYAVNPFKGSEDGMGWNFICQIARFNQVIAITRKNNRPHIEKYIKENPNDIYKNIIFKYHDLPYYLRFWKRGGKGALLYFYLWQLTLPLFIWRKNMRFNILHNVNFHNDWTPTFLWVFNKPLVWGPVGHHPLIPKNYLLPIYGPKPYILDRITWIAKKLFWYIDPFLKLSKRYSTKVLCMNSSVKKETGISENKIFIMPSVSSENVENIERQNNENFNVLSIGRLVPLKGFDITINAFAQFFGKLQKEDKKKASLTIVGKGPEEKRLKELVKQLNLNDYISFINWIERAQLQDLYIKASVFLFPSHEGAGMVVSEALSYGLPVVCFDNYGPGEFITDSCGFKVPYSNYKESISRFAHILLKLKQDDILRKNLSKGAINRFDKFFAWNRKGEQLNNIYKSILKAA